MGKYGIFTIGFILGTLFGVLFIKKGSEKMEKTYEKERVLNRDYESLPVTLEKNFKIEDYKTVSERLNKFSITSRPDFKWE